MTPRISQTTQPCYPLLGDGRADAWEILVSQAPIGYRDAWFGAFLTGAIP